MRRRPSVDYGNVPERLLRFAASDWPGLTAKAAFDAWHSERRAFVLANRDTALGNVVDELRGAVAERRRVWSALHGVPHHSENRGDK